MRFEGSDTIGAVREHVWALVVDPDRSSRCVPGIGGVELIDPTHFAITKVGVGSVRAHVTVRVEQRDVDPPQHVTFVATCRARGTSVRAVARVTLRDGRISGTTDVEWVGDVDVTGRFAMIGARIIDRAAESLISQTLRCMGAQLAAPSVDGTGAPVTEADVVRFDPGWCLFWGSRVTAAQLDGWIPYLRWSANRFAIMTPDEIGPTERDKVAQLRNVIIVEPYVQGLEWLDECRGFRGYLYVGSRPENFQTVNRSPAHAHAWIGHGESGKGSSGFRTGSLYDSIFVADYAAVRRFPRAVRPWVWRGALAIGAPVIEGIRRDAWTRPRRVSTVLYAPTWEGYPGQDFTSLDVVAPVLERLIPDLGARGVTMLLRPHPGTGAREPALKGVLKQLRGVCAEPARTKAEAFERADVLISDVSGITSEFLLTQKPVIMPIIPKLADLGCDSAWLDVEYPWVYRWNATPEGLVSLLQLIESEDPLRARRAAEARRKFRHHRSIEDAARTFDVALRALRWRTLPVPLRLPFELMLLRSRLRGRIAGPSVIAGVLGRRAAHVGGSRADARSGHRARCAGLVGEVGVEPTRPSRDTGS